MDPIERPIDRLQVNRFELKYLIDESCAQAIRDIALGYLVPDPHNDPERHDYVNHTLYMDSRRLDLYFARINAIKNRFKLRLRFYDDAGQGAVFFEIKRRVDDVIIKERAQVRNESVRRLLDGHYPELSDLTTDNPKAFANLIRFCELRDEMGARGIVLVSYLREAYVHPDNGHVRVTFDRQLIARQYRGTLSIGTQDGLPASIPGTILELKFTDRFPIWLHDLVSTLNLRRVPMCKYVECIHALGMHRHLYTEYTGPAPQSALPTAAAC